MPVPNHPQSLAGRVAQTGQPLLIPVVARESDQAPLNDELPLCDDDLRVHSLLIVSLRAQGRVIGTLSLVRLIPDCPLTAEDQATAQSLADRAALAISNARLFSDLETALAQERTTQARLVQAEKFVDVQAYLRAWLAAGEFAKSVRLTVDVDPVSFF